MARFNYYKFPENTPEDVLLKEGCGVVLKSGVEIFPSFIPENKRQFVEKINDILGPMKVSEVKKLMKQYGGSGFTEHYERDGSLFEVTQINLTGNNSRFKYNRHL